MGEYLYRIEPFAISLEAGVNHAFDLSVRVCNFGSTTLSSRDAAPVHLSYHWLDANGNMLEHDGLRALIDPELDVLSTRSYIMHVVAPKSPGSYQLAVDLVREGVSWFGDPVRGAVLLPVRVHAGRCDRPSCRSSHSSKTLLISASDSRFLPLVKGLYLSLLACGLPNARTDLGYIDIEGCESARRWMCERGVKVCRVHNSDFGPRYRPTPPLLYTSAQSLRPFLPELFPEYGAFLWIDGDAWVQKAESIAVLTSMPQLHPEFLAICPTVDTAYRKFYNDYRDYLQSYVDVYRTCFGEAIAAEMGGRAVLSSGVFSMSAKCAIWEEWKQQIALAYTKDYTNNVDALHVAEQLALNVVAHRSGRFVPLEATHNFHCHAGAMVERDATSDKVVIERQPFREVGIVHLSEFRLHAGEYLQRGLLWERGRYLDPDELQALANYRRC